MGNMKTPNLKRVMRAADELLKAVSEAGAHYIAGENKPLAGSVDAIRHWAGAFREIAADAEAVADFYEKPRTRQEATGGRTKSSRPRAP